MFVNFQKIQLNFFETYSSDNLVCLKTDILGDDRDQQQTNIYPLPSHHLPVPRWLGTGASILPFLFNQGTSVFSSFR